MPSLLPSIAPVTSIPGAVNNIVPFTRAGAALAPASPAVAPASINPAVAIPAAFAGGFAIGDSIVRPLLGIEYPGGGGFSDWLGRHLQGNTGPTEVPEPDLLFTGGQSPGAVSYTHLTLPTIYSV